MMSTLAVLLDYAEAMVLQELSLLSRGGVTTKSVKGVVDDFTVQLTGFAVQAFEGRMDKVDFQRAMRALLKEDAGDVYIEGLIEGGFENEADARANMDESDTSAINDWYTEQSDFVNDFAKAVIATRQAEDKTAAQQAIFDRCDLWAKSLDALGSLGRASAQSNKPGTWKLGKTEMHCESGDGKIGCVELSGQRHRVKWFLKNGYIPRQPGNEKITCGGWRCDCSIVGDNGELIL